VHLGHVGILSLFGQVIPRPTVLIRYNTIDEMRNSIWMTIVKEHACRCSRDAFAVFVEERIDGMFDWGRVDECPWGSTIVSRSLNAAAQQRRTMRSMRTSLSIERSNSIKFRDSVDPLSDLWMTMKLLL